MEQTNCPALLQKLLTSQPLAVLATQNRGELHCSLVGFTMTPDFRWLLFATRRQTRKFQNLVAQPRVSLLVDNRGRGTEDFQAANAATLYGNAAETPMADRSGLLAIFTAKHPHLNGFVSQPDCALVAVQIDRIVLTGNFEETAEWVPQP